MKEYKINEYLSVKGEADTWNIYVAGEKVRKYEYKLFNISPQEILNSKDYFSADEYHSKNFHLSLYELDFKTVCTFLKEWCKNHYNAFLLVKDGAFPLLKKLYINYNFSMSFAEISKIISQNYSEKRVLDFLIF